MYIKCLGCCRDTPEYRSYSKLGALQRTGSIGSVVISFDNCNTSNIPTEVAQGMIKEIYEEQTNKKFQYISEF